MSDQAYEEYQDDQYQQQEYQDDQYQQDDVDNQENEDDNVDNNNVDQNEEFDEQNDENNDDNNGAEYNDDTVYTPPYALYVQAIPPQAKVEDVRQAFSQFGELADVKFHPAKHGDDRPNQTRIADVEFQDVKGLQEALNYYRLSTLPQDEDGDEPVQPMTLYGSKLLVERRRHSTEALRQNRLYLGGLPEHFIHPSKAAEVPALVCQHIYALWKEKNPNEKIPFVIQEVIPKTRCAFITVEPVSAAEQVVALLDKSVLNDSVLTCEPSTAKRSANRTIYVYNVNKDAPESELRKFFATYGLVESIKPKTVSSATNLVNLFVCYHNVNEATEALNAINENPPGPDSPLYSGKALSVEYSKDQRDPKRGLSSRSTRGGRDMGRGGMSSRGGRDMGRGSSRFDGRSGDRYSQPPRDYGRRDHRDHRDHREPYPSRGGGRFDSSRRDDGSRPAPRNADEADNKYGGYQPRDANRNSRYPSHEDSRYPSRGGDDNRYPPHDNNNNNNNDDRHPPRNDDDRRGYTPRSNDYPPRKNDDRRGGVGADSRYDRSNQPPMQRQPHPGSSHPTSDSAQPPFRSNPPPRDSSYDDRRRHNDIPPRDGQQSRYPPQSRPRGDQHSAPHDRRGGRNEYHDDRDFDYDDNKHSSNQYQGQQQSRYGGAPVPSVGFDDHPRGGNNERGQQQRQYPQNAVNEENPRPTRQITLSSGAQRTTGGGSRPPQTNDNYPASNYRDGTMDRERDRQYENNHHDNRRSYNNDNSNNRQPRNNYTNQQYDDEF